MDVDWLIVERPGKVKPEAASAQEQNGHQHEYMKASIRAKVEHPFRIIKRQFGFAESQIQEGPKTITNWRCYSPRPTCFGWTK